MALTDSIAAIDLLPRMGVAAPWSMSTDTVVGTVMLVAMALTLVAVAMGAGQLWLRVKACAAPRGSRMAAEAASTVVTAGERWRAILYHLLLSLAIGMLYMVYVGQGEGWHVFYPMRPMHVIAGMALVCLLWLMVRRAIYAWVHSTFFAVQDRARWAVAYRLSVGFEATLLTLCAVCSTGDVVTTEYVLFASVLIVLVAKMALLWCSYRMFLGQKVLILHFFAYLCSAEMIPLAAMWQSLGLMARWLAV